MDQYEVVKVIGEGAFGRVTQIRRRSDGELCVWKELNYGGMSEKEKQMLVSEVNILRELSHPNIVRYFDRIIDREKKRIYIVMEFCKGGDLHKRIKTRQRERKYFSEGFIWQVFFQIATALHACHRKPNGRVLHRDLKPGNIFLDEKDNVKLGDFGLARVMGQDSVFAMTHVGTPYYMSPEQVSQRAYDEKSDIWSLGCLVYEMATLSPPFRAKNHLALAMKIKQGDFHKLPSDARYSADLDRILRSMIQVDPSRRPSIDELLKFPKLRQIKQQVHIDRKGAQLQKQYSRLKAKEEDLDRREKQLDARQRALDERETALNERERQARGVFRDKPVNIEHAMRGVKI